jgi:uracil-DNA glycosylase
MTSATPAGIHPPEVAQRRLAELHAAIRGCRSCVDAGFLPDANPIFMGRAEHRLMILGQAPGRRGHLAARPWSGASGKTLAWWLARAGLPDGALWDWFYLTSVTKCFPGPSPSGNGDRMPSAAEVRLCGAHLDREIALVRPEVVLTLGRMAASALLGNQPLDALVGTVRPAERAGHRMLVVPLPHPSGVSRWINAPANRERVAAALERLGELCRERGLL